MGRSSKPMGEAIVVYQGKTERVPSEVALNYKERAENPEDVVIYCPDRFKTGCSAKLRVVSAATPYYALRSGKESHRGCEYEGDDLTTFSGNIQEHTGDKLPVIGIKDRDMFSPDKKGETTTGRKSTSTSRTGTKKSGRRGRSTREYINTVKEFHEFLFEANKKLIAKVLEELKGRGLLYEKSDFQKLLKNQVNHTMLVQGFLDKKEIQLLKDKGHVYLYETHARHIPSKNRVMLVHNGEGEERFKAHLVHLLEWLESQGVENRKLATVKGKVKRRYDSSKTIVFHVQDLDIKYKDREWNGDKKVKSTNEDRYKIKTNLTADTKMESLDEASISLVSSYEDEEPDKGVKKVNVEEEKEDNQDQQKEVVLDEIGRQEGKEDSKQVNKKLGNWFVKIKNYFMGNKN